MAIYLTKVWGFGVPAGPLQFKDPGWRERAYQILEDGDLVVYVGTLDDPTQPDDRGRLLGIVEPIKERVLSSDFDIQTCDHDLDEDGQYRWPFGLLIKRAWALIDRPLLSQISTRNLGTNAASGIVSLNAYEEAEVEKLRRDELPILSPSIRVAARLLGPEKARRQAAPAPTTMRRGIMHLRNAPAYTYAMELIGAQQSSFKIGWAFDPKVRNRHFNHSAMPELGGLSYELVFTSLWDTARQAYRMEQRLLNCFQSRRCPANHEIICDVSARELEAIWVQFDSVKQAA